MFIQHLPEYSVAWVMAAKALPVLELSCLIIRGHNSSQHNNVSFMDDFTMFHNAISRTLTCLNGYLVLLKNWHSQNYCRMAQLKEIIAV